jgi:hypothetical protein
MNCMGYELVRVYIQKMVGIFGKVFMVRSFGSEKDGL